MDIFDLQAKIHLDSSEYEHGLDQAKGKFSAFGDMLKANVIQDLMSRGLNVVIDGTKKAASAFADLTKQSVSAYADYEQLTGGVQKLYGNMGKSLDEYAKENGMTIDQAKGQWQTLEDAQTKVMQNADQAWKTAGMSANQYMETATSFSASLISSLGGDVQAAADQTDVAMQAISDNVNTFGSNMEDVTNAFKGFSKQNYTMLDNLKLGYGGTKEEMERLIDDANAWGAANGEASNLSIDSFSDVVTAIQQIQEKQQIAGTTAREAMTTIEGSASATKAAWENVKAAISGGGDVGTALNGLATALFGDSEGTGLLNQLIPRVQAAMEGISDFVVKIAPIISEKIPEIVSQIQPALNAMMDAIGSILEVLLPAILPVISNAISTIMPDIVQIAITLGKEFIKGLIQALSDMGPVGKVIEVVIGAFAGAGAIKAISGIVTGIKTVIGVIKLVAGGISTVIGVIKGAMVMIGAVNMLMSASIGIGLLPIIGIIAAIVAAIVGVIEIIKHWGEISEWFKGVWEKVVDGVKTVLQGLADFFTQLWDNIKSAAQDAWKNIVNGIVDFINNAKRNITVFVVDITRTFKELPGKALQWGKDMIQKFASGVSNMAGTIRSAIKGIISTAVNFFKDLPGQALRWGKDMIQNFVNGIKSMIGAVGNAVRSVGHKIRGLIGFSEPTDPTSPLYNFHTFAPDMMHLFAQGVEDNAAMVKNKVNKAFDFSSALPGQSELNINSSKTGNGLLGGSFVFNIYGAEGQDVNEIAHTVADIINTDVLRGRRAYGYAGV